MEHHVHKEPTVTMDFHEHHITHQESHALTDHGCRPVSSRRDLWKKREAEEIAERNRRPSFSDFDKHAPDYGHPIPGTLTALRGIKARKHISGEVKELCHVIANLGQPQPNGTITITFGELFKAYEKISDKVVGMLVRGKRQEFLWFEGEMLYQRQDEAKVITLFKVPEMEDIKSAQIVFVKNCKQPGRGLEEIITDFVDQTKNVCHNVSQFNGNET